MFPHQSLHSIGGDLGLLKATQALETPDFS